MEVEVSVDGVEVGLWTTPSPQSVLEVASPTGGPDSGGCG